MDMTAIKENFASISRKKGLWIACAALVVGAATVGVALNSDGLWTNNNRIDIEAAYTRTDDGHIVDVAQQIVYKNNTGEPLDEVVLHLYPNAYKTPESAPVVQDEWDAAYPNGFSEGGAEIAGVAVDGQAAEAVVDGTLLTIPLPKTLASGDNVELGLAYVLTVPDCRMRFGAGEHSVNLLNAFAIPAVYDGGWRKDGYSAVGDPFVSENADYKVTLSVPNGYTAAATGKQTGQKKGDARTEYTFEAPAARDFAAVLSLDYMTAEGKVGDVKVVSKAPTQEDADLVLTYATQAVANMTSLFGPCAYDEVEVCSADLFAGGMEYPGLAVISREFYQEEQNPALEYCVAHEIAHQWWYGAVGSDQVKSPWLDESLAEYATLLYYENTHGTEGFQGAYRRFVRPQLLVKGLASTPIDQPITSYSDNKMYASVVYAKGAAMWHALRQEMGDEAFFSALGDYYRDNTGRLADKQDLYDALGGDFAQFVEAWLTGNAP